MDMEKSIGEENWSFYDWEQEGSPIVTGTINELSDEELMACYRIKEAEYSTQ